MEWVSRKLLEKSRISLSYKIKIPKGEVWEASLGEFKRLFKFTKEREYLWK